MTGTKRNLLPQLCDSVRRYMASNGAIQWVHVSQVPGTFVSSIGIIPST